MKTRRFVTRALALAMASLSRADVRTSLDILDPEDGVPNVPPPNILCVDVLADATGEDIWVACGIRAVAQNGATLRYATDPNGAILLRNPGTANRFVTFFNKPRGRDADDRFTHAGAASAGRYSPPGPFATTSATEVNVASFASPPETGGSPSVDGAVFRVAINLPDGHTADEYRLSTYPPGTLPANAILYSAGGPGTPDLGTVNAGFDGLPPLGVNWYVAPIPEPGLLALILLASAVVLSRR